MTEKKEKRPRQKPGDLNYVNNKQFTEALDKYARKQRKSIEETNERIQMDNYLAESIMKMSRRLATTKRFSGYPFKEEMIQNGILAAVKYCHNFDGSRFDNGFAYVTQILFSHFIITIKNEKKIYETKLKMVQNFASEIDEEMIEENQMESLSKMIADQKLNEMAKAKVANEGEQKGFRLRTGYTKEARDAYTGGTALWDEEPDDL